MASADKLPLVKQRCDLLTDQPARRRIASRIVVYAGAAGLVAAADPGRRTRPPSTPRSTGWRPAARTNGGAGITLAYQRRRERSSRAASTASILATDGDFNVGVTSEGELVRLIEQERKSGRVPDRARVRHGQPTGLDDGAARRQGQRQLRLHRLARRGAQGARRARWTRTLVTVAKDVKIQVEFNPRQVAAYRLIGYENRVLADEDFNDDTKDAGEIGAGHTVTALYEIVPAGGRVPRPRGRPAEVPAAGRGQDERRRAS